MEIKEVNSINNQEYREKLGKLLNSKLTNFNNEIFYSLTLDWKEIWIRRIVYDLDEKYFKEYSLGEYIWKKVWFFTWTFVYPEFRNKWHGTLLYKTWEEKFKELNQDYIFSDARDTSLWIFIKNWFNKISSRVSKEWYKESIVIKKI